MPIISTPFILIENQQKMNTIKLLILLQTCLCWKFDDFQGPVSTLLSQICYYDASMTIDGEYFYCSLQHSSLKIYKNNGYGFELLQTLDFPADVFYICNSDNGSHLQLAVGSSIYIYQLSNGTYGETHFIDAGSTVKKFACSDDLLIAPLSND